MTTERTERKAHGARWLAWLLGGALLVAVVTAALSFSEERAFVQLAGRAEPAWLAVALQIGIYFAQGDIQTVGSSALLIPCLGSLSRRAGNFLPANAPS